MSAPFVPQGVTVLSIGDLTRQVTVEVAGQQGVQALTTHPKPPTTPGTAP